MPLHEFDTDTKNWSYKKQVNRLGQLWLFYSFLMALVSK